MDADLIYTENKDEVPNLYSAFLLWDFKVIYMLSGKRRELGTQEIHSRTKQGAI